MLKTTAVQKLFEKSVQVTLKDAFTPQCRTTNLLLSIEWQPAAASIHRQDLLITLTDSNDPFFMYNLQLSEEDFQALKSAQGLLMDFCAFPQKFIDLLETCLIEESKANPKFVLIFKVGNIPGSPATLDVVETNAFKHLIHLALKFLVGTESSIKQYLAASFKSMKEENRQLKTKLSYLEHDSKEKVSSYEETLSKKIEELEAVRKELSVELTMNETRHSRELQEERDRFLSKQREEESMSERDRKEKEASFRKEISQLESKVSSLDALNMELQDKNHKRDGTIRDLRSRLSSLEDEHKKQREQLHKFREQNESLSSETKEQRLLINHQKDKIRDIEQELAYKKEQNLMLQKHHDTNKRQTMALQEELDETKLVLTNHAKENVKLQDIIDKGNHIIKNMQHEIEKHHEKLKMSHEMCTELKHQNAEKEKTVSSLRKKLGDVEMRLYKKSVEVGTLSETISVLQREIAENELSKKSKDDAIRILGKHLADNHKFPKIDDNLNIDELANNQPLNANCAGDPVVPSTNRSPLVGNIEKSKTKNRSSSSPLQKVTASNKIPIHATVTDTVCASSPSYNTLDALNVNENGAHLEVDSAAYSATFGDDKPLKHSTAKKFPTGRGLKPSSRGCKSSNFAKRS